MLNISVIYIYYCIIIKYVLKNLLLLNKNNKQNRRNEKKTGNTHRCYYQPVLKGPAW
jgi:hypothetical protein